MATADIVELMTAKQFGRRPDPGYPEELVQGRVVAKFLSDRRNGYVCGRAVRILGNFVDGHDFGRVMCNDSGVITERDPDTVRGADVAYYSCARLSKGTLPTGFGPEVPELVAEVCSTSDRWRNILEKVAEYLNAGVSIMLVLDPDPQIAHVFSADDPPKRLGADGELVLPGVLADFRVRVGQLFE